MAEFHPGIRRDFQRITHQSEGFCPFAAELKVLLTYVGIRHLVGVAIRDRATAVQVMHVITQAVIPRQTFIKRHAVLQAEELTVAAGQAVIARGFRTVAIQTRNTVLQRQILACGQIQLLAQRQHVVLSVVAQFSARVAFRHYVKRQAVFNLRGRVGQHVEAVTEDARFAEHGGGLSAADLFQRAVQFGGGANVEAGVQLVVGITGVERTRHAGDAGVGRHIGIGVFGHGDVNVAVAVLASLRVPHHGSGLDCAGVRQVAAFDHVVEADGGVGGACGKAGVDFHAVHAGVADFKLTGAAVGAGADHVAGQVVGGG
ncbi:hypothetical protein NGUA15_00324 [Salmonella enterica]|nr:hypothetical protein NGUA15_00324 [Salmonella enterica]